MYGNAGSSVGSDGKPGFWEKYWKPAIDRVLRLIHIK